MTLPKHQAIERRDPPGALVLGGAHGSLAIARSLGRHGIPVHLVTDHRLVTLSRYVRRHAFWNGPAHPDALGSLLKFSQRHSLDGAVLFAGGDAEASFIAQNHDALSSIFRLTTLPWAQLRWMSDKSLMLAHAAKIGIDAPRCYRPRRRGEVEQLDCRFPLVLKPALRTQENAFTLAKAWRVDDRAALLARYDQAVALVGRDGIVMQEFIPGGGEAQFSYAAVFDRGMPVATLVARRARQYPVEFGYTSTFVETVDCAAVEAAGHRYLASLDYTGLAEVEFKFDPRDQRYKILDVNARIWTWCALGDRVGTDFPHVQWRLALGETIAPVRAERPAAWVHASRDLVAAARHMLAGRLSPMAWLQGFRKPLVFAAFALDDPLPGFMELPLALWRGVTHRVPILLRDFWRRTRVRATPEERKRRRAH